MLTNVLCMFLRGRRAPRKGFYGMMSRKRGNKHYYKGFNNSNLGRHAGRVYHLDENKLPVYVAPDLQGFALRPYVENTSAAETQFRQFYQARKASIANTAEAGNQ